MKKLIILIRPYGKLLLVIWVVTIISISSVPNLPSPKIVTGGFRIRLDYLFHFFEYGVLTFLTILTFTTEKFNLGLKKYLIITVSLILFAVVDEFHQKLIPGRTFNLKDIISNVSGILTSVIISLVMFRKIAKGLDL